jgi:rhodanese-related sulfurtransferase
MREGWIMIRTSRSAGSNFALWAFVAAFCLSVSGPAFAQMDFGSGSFEQPANPTAPAQNPGGGGGGGSFGDDSFPTGGGAGGQPATAPAPDGDTAAAGGGGSFGDDNFPTAPGGGGQPAPGPAPPPAGTAPPVQPAQPQPSQPGGQQIAIDPKIFAFEMRDFGVPPTQHLRQNEFHAPTPTSIPGGQVASTEALAQAMNGRVPLVLIDVLGAQYSLPQAYAAGPMASPGSFNDRTQQQVAQWLGQVTRGDREMPIVVFCSDPMCWLSYNGSLRAIAAGYRNVYWYRGGLQAWQMAGLPLRPSGL